MKLWLVTVTRRDENPASRMVWQHHFAIIAETQAQAVKMGRKADTFDIPEYEARVIAVRAEESEPVIAAGLQRMTRKKYEEQAVHFPPSKEG